jgi:hypothetical protein
MGEDNLSFSRTTNLNLDPDEDATNPIKALGALMAGAVKGVGGTLSLPLYTNEKLSSIPYRIYSSHSVKEVFQGETPMADFVNQGVDDGAEAIKALTNSDTDSSLGLRYLESVGDNVAAGSIFTKGMTKWGSRLMRSLPAETNAIQRLAIETAKNPAKAQALEALMNTSAAVSGQTVYEMQLANGATQEEANRWRIATEIMTGFSGAVTQRTMAKLKDLASSRLTLTQGAREARAEKIVGAFFDDVMTLDPRAAEKYVAARKVEDIYQRYTGDATGLDLTTAQITRSSPVIAAERMLMTSKPRTAIEAEEHMRRQAEKTEDFISAIKKKGPSTRIDEWQNDMKMAVDRQIGGLNEEINDAVMVAEKEAITLTEAGDPVALGNLGRKKLDTLYEEMDNRIDAMYRTVEDVEICVSSVKGAWTKAMESSLKGNTGGRTPKYIKDIYNDNFGQTSKSSVQKLRDFQKIVRGELRTAARQEGAGSDTYRRLSIIDEGIQNEFSRAASKGYETDLGKAAQHLEIANKLNKEVSTMFKRGELKRLVAEDMQGIAVVSPEDFFRKFVRSNSQNDRFAAAKDYASAFGNPNIPGVSRDLIKQAFLIELRNAAYDPATQTISTRLATNWLEKHSDSIRELGLTGEFDNVGSAAKRAAEIKATNTLAIKDIEKSAFAQSIEGDPKAYVRTMLESGRVSKLLKSAKLAFEPDIVKRGYKQAAWEVLLESTNTGQKIGAGETATLVRQPEKLGAILETQEKPLRELLGDSHYDDLKTLQNMMETVKPVYAPRFSGPMESLVGNLTEEKKMRRGVISKIVAASRHFISPEYATAAVINEFADSLNGKAMEAVFEKALKDPEMARTLASSAKDRKEIHALRTIYSAVLAPLANIDSQEDPTAELRAQFDN